jgi:hypothetical protein
MPTTFDVKRARKVLQLHPVCDLLKRSPNPLRMPPRGEGVRWMLPGRRNCRNRWSEAIARTPVPGMGGIYCLPTSADTTINAEAHDSQGATGTPLLLTQDGLGGETALMLPTTMR